MPRDTFEHQIAYIAVRISIEAPNNQGTSVGTGFLYNIQLNDGTDRVITVLVSNKHVFIDPAGTLRISLNQKNEDGSPNFGNIKNFTDVNFHGAYYEHPNPDVDLACINVTNISRENVFYKNLSSEFLREIDYDLVTQGTEVIFVGYPADRYDTKNNLPLVRKGIIASVPELDFNGRGQIVIDAQVYPGSSGSPVFVAVNERYLLLGVVSETMIRHSQLQTLPSTLPNLGVQEILGLGIVVKQKHVKELFDYAASEFLKRTSS